jgi:hypothetical protein
MSRTTGWTLMGIVWLVLGSAFAAGLAGQL